MAAIWGARWCTSMVAVHLRDELDSEHSFNSPHKAIASTRSVFGQKPTSGSFVDAAIHIHDQIAETKGADKSSDYHSTGMMAS